MDGCNLKCDGLRKSTGFIVKTKLLVSTNSALPINCLWIATASSISFCKSAHFKLQPSKVKEEKEQFIQYLRNEHPELVKESTEYKPKQLDIKKLIADGVFQLTDDCRVVDENGCFIPNLTVDIKEPEVKVKVKQS